MRLLPRLLSRCSLSLALLAASATNAGALASRSDERVIFGPGGAHDVADLRGRTLTDAQARGGVDSLDVRPDERLLRQHSSVAIGKGDFLLRATIVIDEFGGKGAGITFDGGAVQLDDPEWGAVLQGRLFGGGRFPFENPRPASAVVGAPLAIEIERADGSMVLRINDAEVGRIGLRDFALGRIGFDLGLGRMRLLDCSIEGDHGPAPRPRAVFSSADGDIDEFREPSAAADGARLLVTCVGVITREDGTTATELHGRFREPSGEFSESFRIDLGETKPDIAVIGYATGEPRPWRLLVQPMTERRLTESLVILDSEDGRSFSRRGEVKIKGSPVQLLPGSMHRRRDLLVHGGTWLVAGVARACVIEMPASGPATVRDLHQDAGCEPIWLTDDRTLVRTPKTSRRDVLDGTTRTETSGFEGAATAAWTVSNERNALRVAVAEPAFPSPIRLLASDDLGLHWRVERVIWGGAAGHACGARLRDLSLLVFEGGDKARREHILLLDATTLVPHATTPPRDGESPAASGG